MEICYRIKQEQKPEREARLFVTKVSVYSMIANVVTFCTVVRKAISEEWAQ